MSKLLKIRKELGITKKEAASYLDLDIKTYRKYEDLIDDTISKVDYLCEQLVQYSPNSNIGISSSSDDFKYIIQNNLWYVDKILIIKDIINNNDDAILFTRPKRFGKSLNLSMISSFFDIDEDINLFNNLNIIKEKEICNKHKNKYPTIYLTLKDVYGLNIESLYDQLSIAIRLACQKFYNLIGSNKQDEYKAYFMGGTAVYKILDTMNRFSEDIDITVKVISTESNNKNKTRLEKSAFGYELEGLELSKEDCINIYRIK